MMRKIVFSLVLGLFVVPSFADDVVGPIGLTILNESGAVIVASAPIDTGVDVSSLAPIPVSADSRATTFNLNRFGENTGDESYGEADVVLMFSVYGSSTQVGDWVYTEIPPSVSGGQFPTTYPCQAAQGSGSYSIQCVNTTPSGDTAQQAFDNPTLTLTITSAYPSPFSSSH